VRATRSRHTEAGRHDPNHAEPGGRERHHIARARDRGAIAGVYAADRLVQDLRRRGFGLAVLRTAQVQIKYATEQLHFPVWGLSPSSTADDTGGYGGFGVEGLTFPAEQGLSQCTTCATETTVTPHASFLVLGVVPQQAYANIAKLRTLYPDIYTANGGFYDAVNPTTGAVGHRRLVLDQSMIMAALDNALNGNAMQRHFAQDPASWAARTYLSMETMSIH
jgi:hypothetical protein